MCLPTTPFRIFHFIFPFMFFYTLPRKVLIKAHAGAISFFFYDPNFFFILPTFFFSYSLVMWRVKQLHQVGIFFVLFESFKRIKSIRIEQQPTFHGKFTLGLTAGVVFSSSFLFNHTGLKLFSFFHFMYTYFIFQSPLIII